MNAPAYPGHGQPCNGCGQCCIIKPCQLARDLAGVREGPILTKDGEHGAAVSRSSRTATSSASPTNLLQTRPSPRCSQKRSGSVAAAMPISENAQAQTSKLTSTNSGRLLWSKAARRPASTKLLSRPPPKLPARPSRPSIVGARNRKSAA
jgi:hypothetical protein